MINTRRAKPAKSIGTDGFTLVELLMAIAISALILSALLSFYWAQQKTAKVQQDITVLQQDIRGIAHILAQDIRMAGFNPRDADRPNAQLTPPRFLDGILFQHINGTVQQTVTTNSTSIAFTSDLNGNGIIDQAAPAANMPLEQIAYRFYNNSNRPRLQRYSPVGNGWQDVANNLNGIEFCYVISGSPGCTTTPSKDNFTDNKIRVVWVSLLLRSPFPDRKYTDQTVYRPASCIQNPGKTCVYPTTGTFKHFNNGAAYKDHYRRQMLSFAVQCRNIRPNVGEIPATP
ncbi:MAG TPA: hypothetical protein DEB25_07030 [Desulfobulbaceae bacterium]|nr:hypothetical protein [Desulfobulbaceae bacterium]